MRVGRKRRIITESNKKQNDLEYVIVKTYKGFEYKKLKGIPDLTKEELENFDMEELKYLNCEIVKLGEQHIVTKTKGSPELTLKDIEDMETAIREQCGHVVKTFDNND